jgi:hypothetical protein
MTQISKEDYRDFWAFSEISKRRGYLKHVKIDDGLWKGRRRDPLGENGGGDPFR